MLEKKLFPFLLSSAISFGGCQKVHGTYHNSPDLGIQDISLPAGSDYHETIQIQDSANLSLVTRQPLEIGNSRLLPNGCTLYFATILYNHDDRFPQFTLECPKDRGNNSAHFSLGDEEIYLVYFTPTYQQLYLTKGAELNLSLLISAISISSRNLTNEEYQQ